MAPLTRAAVPTGFREPRKIAAQVKMRQKNESALSEVKAFLFFLFYSPPPEPPALQGLLAASLSFAWGTRLSVRVGLMPCTMRVTQGKVQGNPLWLLREKVTVIFHWSAGWNRESHTGAISVWRKSLHRMGFPPKLNGMKHVRSTAQHLSMSGSTVSCIIMTELLTRLEASRCFIKHDFYVHRDMITYNKVNWGWQGSDIRCYKLRVHCVLCDSSCFADKSSDFFFVVFFTSCCNWQSLKHHEPELLWHIMTDNEC